MDVQGLARVPLLQVLPRLRVEQLATELPSRIAAAGQVVARAGSAANNLIILETGSLVAVHETVAGAKVRLTTVVAPCTVDKAATLDEAVHTATWTAITTCKIWLLPLHVLRRLLDQEAALREHVVRYLAAEVNANRQSRKRLAAPDPVAQVAAWLVENSSASGTAVPLPAGQQGLAEELGLSRVTVNRALSTLAALGVIRISVRLINVQDTAHLGAVSTYGRSAASRPKYS